MKTQLLVVCGEDRHARFPLEPGAEAIIGRGIECDIRLTDPSVSRKHCRIVVQNGTATLYDADSRWGTLVNDKPVTCKELQLGDQISIGETFLRLYPAIGPDATTMARPESRQRRRPSVRLEPLPAAVPDQEGGYSLQAQAAARSPRCQPSVAKLEGQEFAGHRVLSLIARARTGVVYRAEETDGARQVALKVFYPESFSDERATQRFVRAVQTMMPIRHENLVAVYAAGRSQGWCYTASEYVDGESAAALIQRIGIHNMLPWQRVFRIAVDLARALQVAEENGIVHRNISPRNILVRADDGQAKLGDLVLAKALEGTRREGITRPGELVGQPEYLSPESTLGDRPLDTRSDIYGLGATLYALLTGRPPLEGRTVVETILKIQTEEPVKPTKYHLSVVGLFEDVVMTMLAKRPEDRYQTCVPLLTDLQRVAKYNGLQMETSSVPA